MPISTDMIVHIAHADVVMQVAFFRSMAHWHRNSDSNRPWQHYRGDCDALLIGHDDGVIIDGNCLNKVSAPDGGTIHVYGDLLGKIDIAGHSEIIIAGDVGPDAVIDASGISNVFVGGKFCGALQSKGSAKLWIGSDFDGLVKTGTPSTRLYIDGDLNGTIVPLERPELLWLIVMGFAAHSSLTRIADLGYIQFEGSIARSDVPPGVYPSDGHRRTPTGGNCYNRWSVRSGTQDRTT